MERAFRRRRLRTSLTLVAAGAAALSAAGATAMAATGHPAARTATASACAKVNGPARVGRIAGIVRAVAINPACQTSHASDPANGKPPLWFHGGNVMTTKSAGALVVTPIFWDPAGHSMGLAYKKIITRYLAGVASSSGSHTNVFSTLREYFGTNGQMRYQVRLGTPINDTDPLPASGCTVASNDTTAIYADNSGYNACLDDNQVIAETNSVIGANHLKINLAHIYVLYLPKHVESCFFSGSTLTNANACTINHQPSAAYCAYHSMAPDHAVYANMPFPIYHSPVGFTCGSDARFPTVQTPNGNADADTEISPTSHEIMEAATDPNTVNGWYDRLGFENGDECAYVFGA
ncbi:MAG TPA: hypothetical protein VF843_04445, partial [Streptosporangiaceae bacterium]